MPHVVALDAKSGKELWRQKAADIKEGYSMTVAPLVADGVLLTGISGGEFGIRGLHRRLGSPDGQASLAYPRTWFRPRTEPKGGDDARKGRYLQARRRI